MHSNAVIGSICEWCCECLGRMELTESGLVIMDETEGPVMHRAMTRHIHPPLELREEYSRKTSNSITTPENVQNGCTDPLGVYNSPCPACLSVG